MKLFRLSMACRFILLSFGTLHAQNSSPAYTAVFTAPPKLLPTPKTPDGPLTGNGDIGVSLGGTPDNLTFYMGKNDFWRAYPTYPGGGIAFPGGLTISVDALTGASYHAEQIMDKAAITGKFVKNDVQVNMKTWVTATHNNVVITLTSNKPCTAKLNLWAAQGNTSVNTAGKTGDVTWVTRSFQNTPNLEWPSHVALAMKVLGASLSSDKTVALLPGKTVTLSITIYTNFDRTNWKAAAIADAASQSTASLQKMQMEHEQWWKKYWSRSGISIGDAFLEKYYTASQYLFACSSRKNKFAPGLWGPFITRDSTAWGGDYHLNYNYQGPYWGSYSSNHIDQVDNYDKPLIDYIPQGKKLAKLLLNTRGIYYPVGLGPKGLTTTHWPYDPDEMEKSYHTREVTIDSGYKFLGQKVNAVFGAENMFMQFYSTYDNQYATRIYPYLTECANFWEDYLKFEDGRYVIYMDHFNEVMPAKGDWRKKYGDVNSTLSLGLVKMLFKGMINVSTYLNRDAARRAKWQHIVDHLSKIPVGEVDGRLSLKNMERNAAGEVRPAGLNRISIHGLIMSGVAGPKTDSAFNQILLSDVSHWKDRMRNGDWSGGGFESTYGAAVRIGYNSDEILQRLKARIAMNPQANLWITQGGGGVETLAGLPFALNEMLLQSYEGVVRIFPNWNHSKDAGFHHLRAYGAFVVSSELKNRKVAFVQLLSEKGRTCTMENPWPGKKVQLIRNGKKDKVLAGNTLVFNTKENENIRLVTL